MVPRRIPLAASILTAILLPFAPVDASAAQETQSRAKIGVHLIPKPAKGTPCANAPTDGFGCDDTNQTSNLVVNGSVGVSYYAYYVLLDIDPTHGVASVGFGIDYDGKTGSGLDIFATDVCGDASYPDENFPNSPPAGITITWDPASNCQRHVDPSDPQGQAAAVTLGLYVYAYADDTLWAIARPGGPSIYNAEVTDCAGAQSTIPYPCYMGHAGFGPNGGGYQPCIDFIGPVEMTSWGRIKRFYGVENRLAFPGDM